MKDGLCFIPNILEQQKAYELLHELGDSVPTLVEIALFIQWTRFDARLAEILVQYLTKNWKKINPVAFNEALLQLPWASAAGVILEFTQYVVRGENLEFSKFKLWKKLVMQGVAICDGQLYFIGLQPLGAKSMIEDARFSLQEYKKWGFLGREVLLNKSSQNRRYITHRFDKEVRVQKIKELLQQNARIDSKSYRDSLGQSISLRQAERDLRDCKFLEPFGQTKGRYYLRKKS